MQVEEWPTDGLGETMESDASGRVANGMDWAKADRHESAGRIGLGEGDRHEAVGRIGSKERLAKKRVEQMNAAVEGSRKEEEMMPMRCRI